MPTASQAQMANSGGRWHLYVALLGTPVSQWPEHEWPRTAPTPTLIERARTLASLGYEVVPAAEWEWIEDSDSPDDPTSPVRLIATVTVRPLRKEGKA